MGQWVSLLNILKSGGRAESLGATGPGGIDFGFGENAIHVHIKNIRDQRNEQEPYDRLPDEMKAQVTQFLFLFLFLHEREKENRRE